jgi:thioredoxin-dependent peroxiredoxin
VVLVVLRGYPGYQCPLCTKQVGELIGKADDFKKAGAQVVLVYPGPADKLKEHAAEFVKGKDYPAHFTLLLDPDYSFTEEYNLRWDAKGETAYPSTFVLDGKRKVTFAKVSVQHGDRAKVADVLKAVAAK